MKRLIALSLLLLSPALVGAQSSQTLNVTSGAMFIPTFAGGFMAIAGNNFSATAEFGCTSDNSPFVCGLTHLPLGPSEVTTGFSEPNNSLVVNLTVDGVPWFQAGAAPASLTGIATSQMVDITGPGTYTGSFTFGMSFFGWPNTDFGLCISAPGGVCQHLLFKGQGTYVLNVTPGGVLPGTFQGEEILTFNAPEPSTTSLLLIAFALLGFQAWVRVRREQRVN
jgi:hypothetical protein